VEWKAMPVRTMVRGFLSLACFFRDSSLLGSLRHTVKNGWISA
jgi:hypothetical protein